MPLNVGYMVGSLSANSINRRLASALAHLAAPHMILREITLHELPLYNYDHDESFLPAAKDLKQAIESSDGLIIVCPEYNRSPSGVLKNAIDYASRPWGSNSWSGKPVAIIGTGLSGAGTAVAQAQLRGILGYLGATVMGEPETCIPWNDRIIAPDGSPDERLAERLSLFLDAARRHFAQQVGTYGAAPLPREVTAAG